MAVELKDIEHLAGLARIAVSDSEKELLRHDLEEILAYVSKIKEVEGGQLTTDTTSRTFDGMLGEIRNVMREDEGAHEGGIFTEDILKQAPMREGDRVLVKKIL